MKTNYKDILKVLIVMVCFYIALFHIINITNKDHKPSNYFLDMEKEGYKGNPLHDRKGFKETK